MKKRLWIIITMMLFSSLLFGCFNNDSYGGDNSSDELPGVSEDILSSEDALEASEEENLEENLIVIDYQFYSNDENGLDFDIPTEIVSDGKTYEYTGNAEYVISEIMDVVEQEIEIEVEDKEEVEKTITYTSSLTGKKYVLSSDIINFSEFQPIKKVVTENVYYGPSITAPEITETRMITYYNKVTEQDEQVEASLISQHTSDAYWLASEEPIQGTFKTDRYGLNSWTVGWNGEEPIKVAVDFEGISPTWDGYQDDVIKWVGADPNLYRVTGARWDSEIYEKVENLGNYMEGWGDKDVVIGCRDAAYPYEALVRDYSATYEAVGETMGYKANVVYFATVEELLKALNEDSKKEITQDDIADDIVVLYLLKASASYREIKK